MPIARPPLSSVSPCSICASRYPICRPRSAVARGRPASPTSRRASRMVRPLLRSRAASMSASVTRADIGAAAEEWPKCPSSSHHAATSTAPFTLGSGLMHAGGFERIDDAKRPIEPARVVLAFEMRSGQQFRSGLCAGAEHIADAVDLGGEAGLGKPLAPATPANAYAARRRSACERRSCRRRCARSALRSARTRAPFALRRSVRHEPQPSMPRHGSLRPAVLSAGRIRAWS